MNTRYRWFLGIGLMFGVLLWGGLYFFWSNHETAILSPKTPTVVTQTPVSNPSSEVTSAAPTPPSTQPRIDSRAASAYAYDDRGQLKSITYPDGSVYSYEYNANGDKIREISRTGKTWTYVYDQNHHPLNIIDPEGRVTPIIANLPTNK